MKKILKVLLLIPLGILITALVVVMLPIAFIAHIVDKPFRKKRQEKLKLSIIENWLPARKYIYLQIDSDFPLANYARTEIMNKFGDHIVVDEWSREQNAWTHNFPNSENRISAIVQDIIGDYDDEPGFKLLTVLPSTKTFDANQAILLSENDQGKISFNGLLPNEQDIKTAVESVIATCIHAWESPEKPRGRITVTIDGNHFDDIKGFHDEVNIKLCPTFKEYGRNLSAFEDVLKGGFLIHEYGEPIKLVWLNADKSKDDLGYEATLKQLEADEKTAHTANSQQINQAIIEANAQNGHTLFDSIVDIIKSQDNVTLELK